MIWIGASAGNRAQLLHEGIQVAHSPVVGDPPVADSHGVDGLEVNGPTGGRDTKEGP